MGGVSFPSLGGRLTACKQSIGGYTAYLLNTTFIYNSNDEGRSTWNALGYKIKKRIPGKKADKLIMIKEIR